jgi:hypothetical protein
MRDGKRRAAPALVPVRVLPQRALSLREGTKGTVSHRSGDELELPADEAKQLIADGFIERAK